MYKTYLIGEVIDLLSLRPLCWKWQSTFLVTRSYKNKTLDLSKLDRHLSRGKRFRIFEFCTKDGLKGSLECMESRSRYLSYVLNRESDHKVRMPLPCCTEFHRISIRTETQRNVDGGGDEKSAIALQSFPESCASCPLCRRVLVFGTPSSPNLEAVECHPRTTIFFSVAQPGCSASPTTMKGAISELRWRPNPSTPPYMDLPPVPPVRSSERLPTKTHPLPEPSPLTIPPCPPSICFASYSPARNHRRKSFVGSRRTPSPPTLLSKSWPAMKSKDGTRNIVNSTQWQLSVQEPPLWTIWEGEADGGSTFYRKSKFLRAKQETSTLLVAGSTGGENQPELFQRCRCTFQRRSPPAA